MKLLSALMIVLTGCASAQPAGARQVVWEFDNLKEIAGTPVEVVGAPAVIETEEGPALEFDGVDDGIYLGVHPLAGWETFTAEVIFRPYPEGPAEQRFFHMQEEGSTSRVMFETRLTEDGRWFLDTFIQTPAGGQTLYAEEFTHPIGPWYHAAIVVDGDRFEHYVNGRLELSETFDYAPQGDGRTSLGMRINQVGWYRGSVRMARFTDRPLRPEEFLAP